MFTVTISGTSKSMLENLFKSTKLLLTIFHRFGEEDSILSFTSKNLTPLRPRFQMSGTLFNILSFKWIDQIYQHVINITPLRISSKKLKMLPGNTTSNIIVNQWFLTGHL